MHQLQLTYQKSSSKLFNHVVKLSSQFKNFNSSNNVYTITTSNEEIILDWEKFHQVFIIIAKWVSFRITIDDENLSKDHAWKLYYLLQEIKHCYSSFLVMNKTEYHCNKSEWGCKKLNSIKNDPEEYGIQWYRFGHFSTDFSKWIIHKEEIVYRIEREIIQKKLFLCPVFNKEKIIENINSLPTEIEITNNDSYEIEYQNKFVGSKIVNVPCNINHVVNDNNIINNLPIENPFEKGSDDWANWEIEQYNKRKKS